MNYRGAVFFDSDGTITEGNISVPTPETVKAIQKLKENGYLAVLSTGRAIPYAGHVIKYFEGISTTNGTYVTVGGKCIIDIPFEEDLKKKIVDYMEANKITYTLENPEMCYVCDENAERFKAWIKKFSIPKEAFSDNIKYKSCKSYKISVMYQNERQCAEMKKEFDGIFSIDMHSEGFFGDITRSCCGKGTGVKGILDYFNIPFENTYAFGDGENDISMFDAVSTGIAMGKHAKSLEAHASFVTKEVRDEGVYYGLKHFGLI